MGKYFYLLLFLFSSTSFAQAIKETDNPTKQQIEINNKLNEIARKKIYADFKDRELLSKLYETSKKMGYELEAITSGDFLMASYEQEGKDKEIVELGSQLKKFVSHIKGDTTGGIASIYRRNAMALGNLGLAEASMKDFKIAIRYAKNTKNQDMKNMLLSDCYENMTVCFIDKRFEDKKYRDSVIYYLKKSNDAAKQITGSSWKISKEGKYKSIAFANMRLGIFYLEQADVKGNIEQAEKHLLESLNIYENKNYKFPIGDKMMILN